MPDEIREAARGEAVALGSDEIIGRSRDGAIVSFGTRAPTFAGRRYAPWR
ncbi:hypothetical protein SAMN04489806_0288 [Paramicrobacterium humi]|uniref:Uncharacterized protein n=1 Tax=Paramicrobacterium humi TaxID=640635 RepID=A0A1H4IWZ8_9MICO|nr:hypothetical protein [Microbacterium humi]SEB37742.1 hypothetical protein SAMN04489806_0288 [Microbacterium humi]